jgi:DNA replication and repair protein RecF
MAATICIQSLMLRSVRLENFRCYEFLDLGNPTEISVCRNDNWTHLAGPNGAGKTSVLEAISLLVPGRGLRGAESSTLQRCGSETPWRACFEFDDRNLILTLGARGRKIQDSTGERGWHQDVSVFWVTPQSAVGFFGDKSVRRKCVDRWIAGVDPEYNRHLVRYKRAYAEWARAALGVDAVACSAFEKILEAEGRAINTKRQEWQSSLKFIFGLTRLQIESVESAQDWVSARRTGVASGVHKADVKLWRDETSAEYASTGECKLMLFGLIYAVAYSHISRYKILLLDDWSENFDKHNQRLIRKMVTEARWLEVWSSGVE